MLQFAHEYAGTSNIKVPATLCFGGDNWERTAPAPIALAVGDCSADLRAQASKADQAKAQHANMTQHKYDNRVPLHQRPWEAVNHMLTLVWASR